MIYRRDEPFRFQFKKPILGQFKILSINGERLNEPKMATAEILDLSPNGLKFSTKLVLPFDKKKLLLEVSFILNDKVIRILGTPIWKREAGPHFIYGLQGIEDQETKIEIVEELKEFSRKSIHIK
ncbi:PilZ domain-containing protein [Bacillus massilinigeriensis]|uniref:PilZ domain-containing protein n=1 Tax=Bacillus massilionigeriensis TaxID=1805475 RepID=UPI00096B5013|nr:PilZ domain-containing protein [Bacillus massilionigeriensis]